jgi:DNA-directed RNA polymerase subunit RPC12/RpoP
MIMNEEEEIRCPECGSHYVLAWASPNSMLRMMEEGKDGYPATCDDCGYEWLVDEPFEGC